MENLWILLTMLACTAVLSYGICLIRKDIDELKELIIKQQREIKRT